MRNFISEIDGEGLAQAHDIADVLDGHDKAEMARFSSRDREDEDEDEDIAGEYEASEDDGSRFTPDAFVGLHPNHRGFASAKLAYRRDNGAIGCFS